MYGRRLHFSWFHFCAVACALLQIAKADFGASDSDNLASVADDVYWIRQSGFGGMSSDVVSILQYVESVSLDVADIADGVADISDGVSAIRADVSTISSNLGSTLGYVEDIKDEVVASGGHLNNLDTNVAEIRYALQGLTNGFVANISLAVSNALASVPLCYNFATNFVGSSVDLSMVTNNTVLSEFFARWLFDHYDYDDYPILNDFFKAYFGTEYVSRGALMDMLAGSSSVGLPLALIWSALPSSEPLSRYNVFSASAEFWFGDYESDNGDISMVLGSPYTIFDAYNTLGLGVLTNQVASVTNALDTLVSVNVGGTNLLNKIFLALTDRDGPVTAIASAVAAVSNAVESSGKVDLDYARNDEPVEWEEQYHGGISEYTNFTRYAAYGEQFSEGLTNQLKRFTEQLNTLPAVSDSTLDITFSGWEFRNIPYMNAGPYHGWTLSLGADPTSEEYKGFSDLTHGIWLVVFRLLEACAIILSCRRIYQIVFPSGYFDVGV